MRFFTRVNFLKTNQLFLLAFNDETFDLQSAVQKSGSKIFYEFNKKDESKPKKIKIVSVPENGILLYNKPMVKVSNQNGWSSLLYLITGIPYF